MLLVLPETLRFFQGNELAPWDYPGVSGIAEKSTVSLSKDDDTSLPKPSREKEEILESSPGTGKDGFLTRQDYPCNLEA